MFLFGSQSGFVCLCLFLTSRKDSSLLFMSCISRTDSSLLFVFLSLAESDDFPSSESPAQTDVSCLSPKSLPVSHPNLSSAGSVAESNDFLSCQSLAQADAKLCRWLAQTHPNLVSSRYLKQTCPVFSFDIQSRRLNPTLVNVSCGLIPNFRFLQLARRHILTLHQSRLLLTIPKQTPSSQMM